MDERLSGYINTHIQQPPVLNERIILLELERRKKRLHLALLSLAGLLWAILFYWLSFKVSRENQAFGLAMLVMLSVSYMCAGCFAGVIIKLRKVSE